MRKTILYATSLILTAITILTTGCNSKNDKNHQSKVNEQHLNVLKTNETPPEAEQPISKLTLQSTTTKEHKANSIVKISTSPTVDDKIFDKWEGNIECVEDIFSPDTSLKMPTNAIILKATYKSRPPIITTEQLPDGMVGKPYNFQLESKYGKQPLSWSSGKYNNQVHVWGANEFGQCNMPEGVSNVVDVFAGSYNMIALMPDDTLALWGRKTPGDDIINDSLENIIQVDGGCVFNVALMENGTLQAWGSKGNGRCDVPTNINDITQISIGVSFGLALRENGSVVAWGFNGMNQCTVPPSLKNVKQVAAGGFHSIALKKDGTVTAWGMNSSGQCNVPDNLNNVIRVEAGDYHSVALKSDGTVIAWGANKYGEGTIPTNVCDIVQIDAGASHNIALKNDGTIIAWGDNSHGECTVPTNLTNIIKIAAQGRGSLALSGEVANSNLRLPKGLTLSTSGLISGTPKKSETKSVLLTLTDSSGYVIEKTLELTVNAKKNNLKITNGRGGGNYSYNEQITIEAFSAPKDCKFDYWEGDTSDIENIHSQKTVITMPNSDVIINAVYKEKK